MRPLDRSNALRLVFVGNPGSVHVQRWVNFFARQGHHVSLLDGFGGALDGGLDSRVTVHQYDAAGAIKLPLAPMLHSRRIVRRLLRRIEPDVVHAHTAARYGWQAALSGFHPYVVSVWGSDILVRRPSWRARFWTRRTLARADLVTAVSPSMADAAVRAGAPPDRVIQIHHGVDPERFHPGAAPAERLAALGLAGERFILSPRSLTPLYNHETILRAAARLPAAPLLVMSDRHADAGYRRRLTELAQREGLGDRVRILERPSEDDMAVLNRAAQVVVSAPLSDSFAVTLLEAMASGTPLVASDLPAVRAAVGDLIGDFLVSAQDVSAMATGLRRALELSPEERQRLGTALRERAIATADYETNMRRMEDAYRRLVRAQRSDARR